MDQNKQKKSGRGLLGSVSLVVFIVCVAVVYIVSNLPAIRSWFGGLFTVFTPVVVGLAFAYLCNPILNFLEKHPLRRIRSFKLKRMLSILLTYMFFILCIALLGILIIPQFMRSLQELFANYNNYIANSVTYINQLLSSVLKNVPSVEAGSEIISLEKVNALLTTLMGSLSSLLDVLLQNIAAYGSKLFGVITNGILAIFISSYLLSSKELRVAQVKKLTSALFSMKHNKFIYDTATLANSAFGSFLGAKLLDSLIVGIIEYIVFSIFGMPYAPMIACIMGVTNIVPFFGPIIGAIPSAFIVFISNPSKLLLYIILVLVIQQIDANIIEPRILGDRTGLSPLCVIIAISVMGNLWGVFGMIVGVPLFAVIIALVQQFLDARLGAKGMSTALDDYYTPEAEHDRDLAQGTARLSWRYYLDRIKYGFGGRNRHAKRPNKQDYLIYPQPKHAVSPAPAEIPTETENAESTDASDTASHE